MTRFSRFRRKHDAAAPASSDNEHEPSVGSRTPSPGAQMLAPPPPRSRDKASRSPLRAFRLRSSAKRARESPPASLPQSPTAHSFEERSFHTSLSSTMARGETEKAATEAAHGDDVPKIPAFLSCSPSEINAKFQEIQWLQTNREAQALSNPSVNFRWAKPSGPRTKHLDRYMNIQPWANNRVKLKVAPDKNDYINASPIGLTSTGGGEQDRYIAMQGPKQATTNHVWRMIVEQLESPAVVVMLTQTHEANMEKCFAYFPRSPDAPPLEINERDEFGDQFRATVFCEAIEETEAGNAIELRKLVIKVHKKQSPVQNGHEEMHVEDPKETQDVTMQSSPTLPATEPALGIPQATPAPILNGSDTDHEAASSQAAPERSPPPPPSQPVEYEEERVVYHFLYTKWPDFGVPHIDDLDSFFTLMRLSRAKNAHPANPRIVHCSAGVGRSGTFIALEHLMRELDAGVLVDWDAKRPAAARSSLAQDANIQEDDVDYKHHFHHGRNWKEPDTNVSEAEADDLIFTTVNQLREQRPTMVQAPPQYLFIYMVLRKLWQDKYGVLEEGEPAAKRLEIESLDPFVESGSE